MVEGPSNEVVRDSKLSKSTFYLMDFALFHQLSMPIGQFPVLCNQLTLWYKARSNVSIESHILGLNRLTNGQCLCFGDITLNCFHPRFLCFYLEEVSHLLSLLQTIATPQPHLSKKPFYVWVMEKYF